MFENFQIHNQQALPLLFCCAQLENKIMIILIGMHKYQL